MHPKSTTDTSDTACFVRPAPPPPSPSSPDSLSSLPFVVAVLSLAVPLSHILRRLNPISSVAVHSSVPARCSHLSFLTSPPTATIAHRRGTGAG